jgi:stalled ribosome rescue protein Dom34
LRRARKVCSDHRWCAGIFVAANLQRRGAGDAMTHAHAHHAAIWIDHNEARAISLDNSHHALIGHVRSTDTHTHPTKEDGHRHPSDPRFLLAVEELIAGCDAVIVFGPSQAKDDLVRHLSEARSTLSGRIVGVESLDRVTDGELATRAREMFVARDCMAGVHVGTRGMS